MWDLITTAVVYERASDALSRYLKRKIAARSQSGTFHYPNGREEDYLCLVSELTESLGAMDNGPAIFNT